MKPITSRDPALGTPALRAGRPATAFTLVEIIAVMIILGVLASVVVPRVVGLASRQAQAEARQVQDLLSLAAEKAAALSAPTALGYKDSTFTLLTMRSGSAAAERSQSTPEGWTPDPLAETLAISRLTLAGARSDGSVLDTSAKGWQIEFRPGRARPSVELDLRDADQRSWTVRLDADATRAVLLSGGASSITDQPRVIDLDDAGRGTTPW